MNKRVLVLGRGYLGTEFERHGFEVWGRDRFDFGTSTGDISILALSNMVKNYDVVINCIGKSNTRWCEDKDNFAECMYVNSEIPRTLSKWCNAHGLKFVQISTGCLYDDTTKANTEDSFISAHCNYTISKLVGENYCNTDRDIILRPRLYFSDIKDKNNLLCKLPQFSSYTGDKLDSFTCTSTIVGATKALIAADATGVFNVAQIGSATIARIAYWCGLPITSVNTAESLRMREGLYLVNNVMDISKLLRYYIPSDIETAVRLSYAELTK